MPRRLSALPGLLAIFAVPVCADWKIITVFTSGLSESTQTEYFKGGKTRTEQSITPMVSVYDSEHRRQIFWNPKTRQYSAADIPQMPEPSANGPEIVVTCTSVDTGERKVFFGHEARHIKTRESRSDDSHVTEIDGWYLDSPALPRAKTGRAFLVLSQGNSQGNGGPRVRVDQTGPAPKGLAVQERMVWQAGGQSTRVISLVETKLSDDLFNPPKGYKRVSMLTGDLHMPWYYRLREEWESFEGWVASLLS